MDIPTTLTSILGSLFGGGLISAFVPQLQGFNHAVANFNVAINNEGRKINGPVLDRFFR
jgi:hypothetical protein